MAEELQKALEEEGQRTGIGLQEMESRFSELRARNQSILNQLEEEKGTLIDTLTQLTSLGNRLSHLDERREDFQKRIRSQQLESDKTKTGLIQLEESLKERVREKELGQSVHSILHEEKTRIEGETEKLEGNFTPETVGAFREGREVEAGPLSLSFAQRASREF